MILQFYEFSQASGFENFYEIKQFEEDYNKQIEDLKDLPLIYSQPKTVPAKVVNEPAKPEPEVEYVKPLSKAESDTIQRIIVELN